MFSFGLVAKRHLLVLIYIAAILLLMIADFSITWYLIKYNLGEEFDLLTNTSSFSSLLLSPAQLLYLPLCIGSVIFCEQNMLRASRLIQNTFLLHLFCLPYCYLVAKLFVVLNNILVAFRFDGPVFWLIDFFDMGDRFGLTVALAIVAVMILPIAENLLKDRYSPIGE
jgi:hypothetical protein